MNTVSLVDVPKYDLDLIYNAVISSLKDIGFNIPQGKSILLKPNIMAQNRPEQHSVTHCTFVEAVVKLLKENDNIITIGESSAFYQKGLTELAFDTSRMSHISRKYGIKLLPFEKSKLVKITDNIESRIPLYLPEEILNADMVLGLPKLKTHSGLRMSGAVKNMYGCLPGGYKQLGHIRTENDLELSDIFIDICETVKPSLFIMDAIMGLDGGPSSAGKARFTGRVITSSNAHALDAVAAKILGYNPMEIPTLIRAHERGLIDDFRSIEIKGTLPDVKFKKLIRGPVELKKEKDSIFITDTFVTPFISKKKCNLCMECIDFCPAKAIIHDSEIGGFPLIDYSKCIHCYHCLYACPAQAFRTRSTLKNRFINSMRLLLDL